MENINFYKVIPKAYLKPLATYKNYSKIHIDLPIRAIIAGSSGSGKTNAVMNMVKHLDCFDRFYLFVGDDNESLYHFLIDIAREKMGDDAVFVSNNITEVPEISEFDPTLNNLVVIDDLVNEKGNGCSQALNLFTNGRKANISVIYVTQDYIKVNLTIRKNSKILILTRFDDESDLDRILSKFKRKLTLDQIKSIYKYATHGGMENFFCIDMEGKDEWRYRRNLVPIPL